MCAVVQADPRADHGHGGVCTHSATIPEQLPLRHHNAQVIPAPGVSLPLYRSLYKVLAPRGLSEDSLPVLCGPGNRHTQTVYKEHTCAPTRLTTDPPGPSTALPLIASNLGTLNMFIVLVIKFILSLLLWPFVQIAAKILFALGFAVPGVIKGSIAAWAQSAIYGAWTTGVFSAMQSTGAVIGTWAALSFKAFIALLL
ncbi:hypothetical protein BD413DRAFT_265677 [Trametes elegans]|nr:hypothetical protein BD413DRAFT_265677 [Trametes elegans]